MPADGLERRGARPEAAREARGLLQLERLWADVVYALRMMRRNPGFTAVAVATLALGIGVNTALFTSYNALVLKPLPVVHPDRVVRLERWFVSPMLGDVQYNFSYPEYLYLRRHTTGFASVTAMSSPLRVLAEWRPGAANESVSGQLVSAGYFAAMGVPAQLGRSFFPEEDSMPGNNPVIVLSHAAWKRRFLGEPGAVGRVVKLNGTAFTIIGVAPEKFTGTSLAGAVPDFWATVSMQAQLAPGRDWLHAADDQEFQVLARLKDGVAWNRAQAETDLLVRQFAASHTERDKTAAVTLQHTSFLGNTEDPRFVAAVAGVMLVVGLVLLVACANLANLLLARTAGRQREISLRLALGASRARVIRQLLTESVTLALLGGAAGLVLANWCSQLLWVAVEEMLTTPAGGSLKLGVDLTPDLPVYLYALGISVATGILFGISPALRSTRPDLIAAIRDEATGYGAGWTRSRLRNWLVGGQVAVSMLLLITAGLLLRGLTRSQGADPGFETRGLSILSADFGTNAETVWRRQQRLMERLRAVPEVSGAAIGGVPLLGTWTPRMIAGPVDGRTLASFADESYLATVGIRVVRGRAFTKLEAERGLPVAVISECAAQTFWPGLDPLGRRFQLDLKFSGVLTEFEVVGVAKEIRYGSLSRPDLAHVYLAPKPADYPTILLRTRGDSRTAAAVVRSAVQSADAELVPGLRVIAMEAGPLWLQRMTVKACALSSPRCWRFWRSCWREWASTE